METAPARASEDDLELDLYRSWRWEPTVEGSFDYEVVSVHPGTIVVAGGGDAVVTADTFDIDGATWDTTIQSSNGFSTSSELTSGRSSLNGSRSAERNTLSN